MQFILGVSAGRVMRISSYAVVNLSIDRYERQKRYDLDSK
jgi:hypothetical protein